MIIYNVTLQGDRTTEEEALEWARGFFFSECEQSEYHGKDHNYIDTIDGIDAYYHFGADYYFFTDSEDK